MVEVKVGREKQKVGTKCTEEESNDKRDVRSNNSMLCLTEQNPLLDPAMAVMDIDQLTLDIQNLDNFEV